MIPEGYITFKQFKEEILNSNYPTEAFEIYKFQIERDIFEVTAYYPYLQQLEFTRIDNTVKDKKIILLPISSVLTGLEIGTMKVIGKV